MVLQWLIRSVTSFMSSAWSSSYEILNLVFIGCAWLYNTVAKGTLVHWTWVITIFKGMVCFGLLNRFQVFLVSIWLQESLLLILLQQEMDA